MKFKSIKEKFLYNIRDENDDKNNFSINDFHEEKYLKEFNSNKLILNGYWIELISKISFALSLIICEIMLFLALSALISLIDGDIMIVKDVIIIFFIDIGLKWPFIVSICQHLSIGFFCLTNFSNFLKEKDNMYKFLIINFIKSIFFYFLSIIILGNIIKDGIFGNLIDEVNKVEISPDGKNKIFELINDLEKITIRYVGNLLADYNNSLDKLLIGSLYSILFSSPKFIKEKNIIYFRLLFIILIIYILFSITLRTLNNLGKIDLSLYISPFFVGPKFIIYGFFVSLLFI